MYMRMKIKDWEIGRKDKLWPSEKFERRIYQTPEKIEFHGVL